MKQIIDFPCIPFAQLPTPLYKLENLSREIGKNIYIKRDDMTGVALGGNKVRKLEFLLADARDKVVDVVLTAGGPQSNHAMLTAACAGRLGVKSILVLKKWGKLTGGNLILNGIFGAEVRMVDTDSYDDVYAEMTRIMGSSSGRRATLLMPFLWAARSLWAALDTSTVRRKLHTRRKNWTLPSMLSSAPPVPAVPMRG